MEFVPVESSDAVPDESPILDALEQYSQFIDELYDVRKKHSTPIFFDANLSGTAIRSVRRVLRDWDRAFNPNRPPSALIVRLSRSLPSVLADVAGQPKRTLKRRRAMEPINRLKELDSTCARWLTRQPGKTLAEKSGHRRAVLAVQRYESVDTLENRVVRDLLQRCASLAADYLRQYAKKYPTHEWVRMTSDFSKLCHRLLALPHLQEVAKLPSLPKPNYVLLHETRYKEVWRSYMEVIRQQRRRQQLWRWRQDVYAEMLAVALMSSASRKVEKQQRPAAHRFDMRVRDIAINGRHFDWLAQPPIWRMNSRSRFYVGTTESIGLLPVPEASNFNVQGGFSIAGWNGAKFLASRMRVKFPDEKTLADSPQTGLVIVDLQLFCKPCADIDPKQLLVPLRLIEHPKSLDALIDDWCLS